MIIPSGHRWRDNIHTFAQVASGGEWYPFPHLRWLSMQIGPAVARGGARIIVNMPPRHGKSELICKWLPAWFLHWWPRRQVLMASYEAGFASEWSGAVLDLYKAHGGDRGLLTQVHPRSNAARKWQTLTGSTVHRGGMQSAGVGGAFTGKGGGLLLLDDPHKNLADALSPARLRFLKSWYDSTFHTRAQDEASIICVHTRWHKGDMSGYLLDEWGHDGWTVLTLPAEAIEGEVCPLGRKPGEFLCPDLQSAAKLLSAKQRSPHLWASMYQQRPIAGDSVAWRPEWVRHYENVPGLVDLWFQSWDFSFSDTPGASYVVGQVWAVCGPDRYLVHQVRGRWDLVDSLTQIRAVSMQYPQAFLKLVEGKANGDGVISLLQHELGGFERVTPVTSKIARAIACQPEWMTGHVHVPHKGVEWVPEYLEEVTSFPAAANDDQVDATSQALQYVRETLNSDVWVARATKPPEFEIHHRRVRRKEGALSRTIRKRKERKL